MKRWKTVNEYPKQVLCEMFTDIPQAGIPMSELVGSQTSCFVGCFTKDYESRAGRDPCK